MNATITKVRNGVLAVAMAGALAFGGTQALARPAEAQTPPTCNPAQCDKDCKAQYGSFASGYCDAFGGCSCAV